MPLESPRKARQQQQQDKDESMSKKLRVKDYEPTRTVAGFFRDPNNSSSDEHSNDEEHSDKNAAVVNSSSSSSSSGNHDVITEHELTECDRQPLHLLGHVQGGAGHVLFFDRVHYTVVAVDKAIGQVPWISGATTSTTTSTSTTSTSTTSTSSSTTEEPRWLLGKTLPECLLSELVTVDDDDDETSLLVAISKALDEMRHANMTRNFIFVRARHKATDTTTTSTASTTTSTTTTTTTAETQRWSISLCCADTDESTSNTLMCLEIEPIHEHEHEHEDQQEEDKAKTTTHAFDFQNTLVRLSRLMEGDNNSNNNNSNSNNENSQAQGMKELCATACEHVFNLFRNKYDRGMVYVFKDDLSGEVIHEIKLPRVSTSYKGLRFPATDIPKPARELFLLNGLRYNYNIEVPDNPILSIAAQQLDLTHCRMRAIHKPHIIYLRNMGVVSSLAIAIVVQDELWGLLTFHRYGKEPFKPNLHQRIACETIAKMVSTRIERKYMEETHQRSLALNQVWQKWDRAASVISNITRLGEEVKAVCDADCVAIHIDKSTGQSAHESMEQEPHQVVIGDSGLVPSRAGWEHLATALPDTTELVLRHSRAGVQQIGFASAEQDCPAGGFCYFRQGPVQVFFGRALRSADVAWAGDPDLPKLRIGGILNPRASFDKFMETARLEARRWSPGDLLVINLLRCNICN